MTTEPDQIIGSIHQQFLRYYDEFLRLAERASDLFVAGRVAERLHDDLLRVQMYHGAIHESVNSARKALDETLLYDLENWTRLRARFRDEYTDELATTYFTSVIRKIFAQKEVPVEFEDDGIGHHHREPDEIVHHFSLEGGVRLGDALKKGLKGSVFSHSFAESTASDIEIVVDIINEHLPDGESWISLELATPPFFRGKGAYIVGQLRTSTQILPLVLCFIHVDKGVKLDAALAGYEATRNFLFSSTRSAFTVSIRYYQELYSFLARLYPAKNPAYILDIIGFTHPAKISLLQQLRTICKTGGRFEYLGKGDIDFVFGVEGFPLVFKVIRGGLADRQSIIRNFIKVHTIDRLGQILDSLDYRNLLFERQHFSEELIEKLRREESEDVLITEEHVFLKRVYAARRIVPVIEQVRTSSKKTARQILLKVGWNIKHLAAMGFFPKSLGLDHFGLTSWGRVVYLDNASLVDLRLFDFCGQKYSTIGLEQYSVDPADFEQQLKIPPQHKEIFRAIHGDLFSARFWEEIKIKVHNGHYPDFFPYPSSFRVEPRKFRCTVLDELHRVSDAADVRQIHMALDNLAVVDVELAGLVFLRLEVARPSARVLVVEPIGPEIIAQLHHRFKDVTFDILQSESEVVENDGQWTPGIHGKLHALVQVRRYDYVLGYVNETFDEDFFRLARLKGFLLLSTGTHNIDIEAATRFHTVVTNAPGPTTTTVAEQNIGLMLDALYSRDVRYGQWEEGFVRLGDVTEDGKASLFAARIMWLCLLRQTLRLEEMFTFGASDFYVRTGVGEQSTVYHEQIGQNKEAGIVRSVGVVGLEGVGLYLVEFSIAHELSTIYVLDSEYDALSGEERARLDAMLGVKENFCETGKLRIEIAPVSIEELHRHADFLFVAKAESACHSQSDSKARQIRISMGSIFVRETLGTCPLSSNGLTLGILGLGRIGEAVAQRALMLGLSVMIYQRDPDRPRYQKKLDHLKALAAHHDRWNDLFLAVDFAENKDSFFRKSNIITTLAATTNKTRGWVGRAGLEQFAKEASCPVQVIVSAGKGLIDEDALVDFLAKNAGAEARLDVLVGEHEGGAYLKFVADDGQPLANLRVTGHTAAAVREVRQLKIFKALDNLRGLIDGRIPPNIVNNSISKGKPAGKQSITEVLGLKFFRLEVPSPKARVLVIEPLPAELVLYLQQHFGDVSFDILLAESELIQVDGQWVPGINDRLNAIISEQHYDYCLGYCNANFDASFFTVARLRGLILFATATHHIDLATASKMETVVTNSAGYTTVAVTEQNIAMALDILYGGAVLGAFSEGMIPLSGVDVSKGDRARQVAQILWFVLLRRALRLGAMFEFGSGDKYVRTGVRQDATVYHDQLGQHDRAGIKNRIAVIGLDEVGLNLVELAIGFELSEIFVLEDEYRRLSSEQRNRLEVMAQCITQTSMTKAFSVKIVPLEKDELVRRANYTIKTPAACASAILRKIKTKSSIHVHADRVYIRDSSVFDRSLIGLTFGVQGLGRIGEAVVQRALVLGADVIVCQRNPERPKYQEKLARLKTLAEHMAQVYGKDIDLKYVDKTTFFTASNVVTTLAATTSSTRFWVDREALNMLGRDAVGNVRGLVNAGKGLLNEADLEPFLRENPEVQVRLDVLSDEQRGKAGERFRDIEGKPLANLKIAGHTAAAVPELRRLKILNAFNNLRLHVDGQKPNDILNGEVYAER